MLKKKEKALLSRAMKMLASKRSKASRAASRANGKKGGRPRGAK